MSPTLLDIVAKLTLWFQLIVPLAMALAIVFFFWGIVKFLWHADDERTHEEGRRIMIWGMIALFVMVALWGIIGYFQNSIGLPVTSGITGAPEVPIKIPTSATP
jgi:Na+/proline symporter